MPSKYRLRFWKLKLILQSSRGIEKFLSQTLDIFCNIQTNMISSIQWKQNIGRLSRPFCVGHLRRNSLELLPTPLLCLYAQTNKKTQLGKLQALFLALSSLEIYLHLGGIEIIRKLEAFSNWCGVICGFGFGLVFFFLKGKYQIMSLLKKDPTPPINSCKTMEWGDGQLLSHISP